MATLRSRVEEQQRIDASRQALLEQLLTSVETLTKERDDVRTDLEMTKHTSRTYYQQMMEAKSQVVTLQTSMDCDRFVLVLIDGDSMPFLDELVQRGADGGEEASKSLRSAVHDYYRTIPIFHPEDRIIIRIFANLHGLARTYRGAQIIADEVTFINFVSGFNKAHPLSDFVDAGNQKEAADSKMKATMELFYRNRHCKHIIFGGSADSSYAGFLGPYAPSSGVNDRITMLESIPFAWDLRKTASRYPNTTFRGIFRTTKISTRIVPSLNGAQTASLKRPALAEKSPPRSPKSRARSVGTDLPMISTENNPSTKGASTSHDFRVPRIIYQNQKGQRIDERIEAIDRAYLQELFAVHNKLCNNFYLKDFCPYGENCQWDHSEKLTRIQQDTLRYKARSSACRDTYCQVPDCVLGHMCPRGSQCEISRCKFTREMHDIDISDVRELNVDTGEYRRVSPPR